jgi:hypothetical protein
MMSDDLAILIAKDRIRHALGNYCRAMDRIDDDLARSLWHPGGEANYEQVFEGTGDEFCDWVAEFHRGLEKTSHEILHSTITVTGSTAASETYVEVNLLRKEGGRHILTTSHGRYLDQWSERDGRWAVDKRRYVRSFSIHREVDATIGTSKADRTDPSYSIGL